MFSMLQIIILISHSSLKKQKLVKRFVVSYICRWIFFRCRIWIMDEVMMFWISSPAYIWKPWWFWWFVVASICWCCCLKIWRWTDWCWSSQYHKHKLSLIHSTQSRTQNSTPPLDLGAVWFSYFFHLSILMSASIRQNWGLKYKKHQRLDWTD